MSNLKQVGNFATPYGISVPAFEHETDRDDFVLDMSGMAVVCGIYDPADRKRFADHVKNGGSPKDFAEFGGHIVQCSKLPRPKTSVYKTIPADHVNIPIEAWIDGALERRRWVERAEFFEFVLSSNMACFESEVAKGFMPQEVCALSLSILLTASLELLPDQELDCVEAAAFFGLSLHDEWREPAQEWLRPFRHTWLKDWIAARPNYRKLAKLRRSIGKTEIPVWMTGGAA